MGVPTDRRYSESHEWHLPDGDLIVIGITQFAVDQLTDVTFAEMKAEGTEVAAGEEHVAEVAVLNGHTFLEIGRASCRERVLRIV